MDTTSTKTQIGMCVWSVRQECGIVLPQVYIEQYNESAFLNHYWFMVVALAFLGLFLVEVASVLNKNVPQSTSTRHSAWTATDF